MRWSGPGRRLRRRSWLCSRSWPVLRLRRSWMSLRLTVGCGIDRMSRSYWPVRLGSIGFVSIRLWLVGCGRSGGACVRRHSARFSPIWSIWSWCDGVRRSTIRLIAIRFVPIRLRMWLHPGFRTHHRSWTNTLVRLDRLRSSENGGPALVYRDKLCAVLRGILTQFHLRPHWRSMWRAVGSHFSARRAYINPVRPAVVADPVVDHRLVDDGHIALIHIGDVHIANIVHRAVVVKVIAAPVAALVTDAYIAEAIIDAAVEADITAPISMMKAVAPSRVAPVAGCPERSLVRWLRPCAGYPVVAA
jgi:hypothetical protein